MSDNPADSLRRELEAAILREQAAFYAVPPSDVSESSGDIADAIWPLIAAALEAARADERERLRRAILSLPNEWTSSECRSVFAQAQSAAARVGGV